VRVLLVHNRYRSAQPSGENAVVDAEAALLEEHGCTVERVEADSDDIEGWSGIRKATLPVRVVWSRDATREIRDAIARFEPDVVHVHNTFPLLSPAAVRAAKAAGAPVVLTFHNFRPLCAAGAFIREGRVCEDCIGSRAPFAALRHGCYRGSRVASAPLVAMSALHRALGTWTDCVDVALFPSEFARAKYIRAGWPADKCVVKYNTAPDLGRVREGAGEGFVAVSRLSAEKGIDLLVDAWREAFPDGRATLTIIGSGEDEAQLKERASGLDSIRFVGQLPRERVMAEILRARALLIPSRCYEVFPRVAAEAYSAGVPIIATATGALAEIVQHEETGLLVDPDSNRALASALQRLHASPLEAMAFGAGARRAYEDRYGPEPTTEALLGFYARATVAGNAPLRRVTEKVTA
jgi:glycosyltransferase involved in cell wall biosynthesis